MSFTLTFADGSTRIDVRKVVVHEGLSTLWSVTIIGTSSEHDLPFEDLIDRGAACALESSASPRLWSGIVTAIEHLPGGDGLSHYRVELRPELWRASVGRRYRVFQHVSIPEIVLHVLEDWGLVRDENVLCRNFEASDTSRFPKYEYRLQAEESDFHFVCRLLEEAGISFYFEFANRTRGPEGETKGRQLTKLVLDAEPQLATDPGAQEQKAEAEERDASAREGGEDSKAKQLKSLTYSASVERSGASPVATRAAVERSLRPGAVMFVDHDFTRGLDFRAQQRARVEDLATAEAKYEIFQFVPGLQQGETDAAAGDRWLEDRQARRAAEFLASLRASATIIDFATSDHTVLAGAVVKFASGSEAHGRAEISAERKLLVVESQIVGDADGARWTSCRAVTAEVPYRPLRVTPKPRIYGLQSALVVGPGATTPESIHCDAHGRVKVQFHWDRQHRYGAPLAGDAKSLDAAGSCWVRVLTPWAGAGYGVVAIPRVGHEVFVGFLDGDPDQPIVVGSAHNGANAIPFARPDAALVSGLRSASSPGGGGMNELSFDDRKGNEKINIQAERDLSTVVKADESRDIGRERTTVVAEIDALHVQQKEWQIAVGSQQVGIKVLADKSLVICVNGDSGATVKLGGPEIAINAKGAIHYVAKGDMKFSAMSTLSLDATRNVYINEPDRSPASPQTDSHPAASSPAGGARIPPARLPSPAAPPMTAPGEIMADVDFGGGGNGEGEDEAVAEPEVAPAG